MGKWNKVIASPDDISPDKTYFVARQCSYLPNQETWMYLSRPLKGPKQWATKPGIAIRYRGSPKLAEWMKRSAHEIEQKRLVAIEVPADANTRWKARAPVTRTFNRRPA